MIEIIKKGTVRYQWTCVHCKCIFLAAKEDEKHEMVMDNQGIVWNEENTTRCPTCGRKLSDTMLPSSERKEQF